MKNRIVKITNSYSKEVFYVVEYRFLFVWLEYDIDGCAITYNSFVEATRAINEYNSKEIKEIL
jgi:hypothetical protein